MDKRKLWSMFVMPGLAVMGLLAMFLLFGRSEVGAVRGEPAAAADIEPAVPSFAISRTTFATSGVAPTDVFSPCSGIWITQTVDSGGIIGRFTSLALEPTYPYTPHISYIDATIVPTGALKHAWLSGTTWLSETIDAGCERTSLALAPTYPYTPAISYDDCGSHIKFAWLSGTTWISMTVPGPYAGDSSLALEPTYPYTPHISYYWAWDKSTLYHAYLSGTLGLNGTWVYEAVEPIGSKTGWHSSLALEPTDPYTLHISYYYRASESDRDLRYAWLSGTTWLTQGVDSAGDMGIFPSLALDSKGNPHVSYIDNTNNVIKYAWLSNTIWFSGAVDNIGELPYNRGHSSLKLDRDDAPYIGYYDAANGDLKLAHLDGMAWITQTVDSEGDVGQFVSLALDQFGCPHISYYFTDTVGALKYAYLLRVPTASFTAWPTAGVAPLTVAFTNTTIGDYAESLWSFGDGMTDIVINPTHIYTTGGLYTVTLTANGPGGSDTITKTKYIKVDYGLYLPITMKGY